MVDRYGYILCSGRCTVCIGCLKAQFFFSSLTSTCTSNSLISLTPAQVLQLYTFYSKPEKHLKDTLTLELKDWISPDEILVKNTEWPSYSRWR